MTSKRKSHRSKKNINYADSNSNYESDDDFEAEFEPRSKKVKTKGMRNKDEIKREKIERKSPVQRLSVDEKLYQRNIEKALKISLSDSASSNEEQTNSVRKAKTKRLPGEEDSDYEPEQETICKSEDDSYCGENNDSDFSEGEVRRKTISKETKANRKKSSKENIESEDSDYEPEQETICESEDDNYCGENNDSDFSEGEVRRKTISKETKANRKKSSKENIESASRGKKLTSVIKETEKVLPPSTTPLQTTKVISANQKNNAVAKKPPTKSPVVNRNLSSLGLRGVVIKNPGPPLRVGLSRNMKVKPLHSKVSVSH